ncbi:PIN domain nuclease [Rhabdobacter roseus]|uniref:PIN domain-containing protein n=1 Tax=Rhabdobacter roseus TaxID=1655419 RepID=A0A840U2K9_9BACT|nr:PIN domain nuclease [Rhabdobacter roseus]MBB5286360.1 hypothetical protein [Rhabdobacter roseus]
MLKIFDSTIWIDYFRGIQNDKTDHLAFCIDQNSVAMLGVIVQEVLQGVKNDTQYELIKDNLLHLPALPDPTVETYAEAAQLYRSLRKKGLTIRKPNDCLIAYYALHFGVELCHNDSDFELMAAHTQLRIWKPTS